MTGNLIKPTLQFLFIAQTINTSMDFEKNILEDIFRVMFVWNASANKLFEPGMKFFPYISSL